MSWLNRGLFEVRRSAVVIAIIGLVITVGFTLFRWEDSQRWWLLSSGVVASSAWFTLFLLRSPDRHNAAAHAHWSGALTFVATWTTALFLSVAFFTFAAAKDKDNPWTPLVHTALLVATNVGGVLALLRSVRTRTETGATLQELSTLRIAALSGPLVDVAAPPG